MGRVGGAVAINSAGFCSSAARGRLVAILAQNKLLEYCSSPCPPIALIRYHVLTKKLLHDRAGHQEPIISHINHLVVEKKDVIYRMSKELDTSQHATSSVSDGLEPTTIQWPVRRTPPLRASGLKYTGEVVTKDGELFMQFLFFF